MRYGKLTPHFTIDCSGAFASLVVNRDTKEVKQINAVGGRLPSYGEVMNATDGIESVGK